MRMAFVPSDSWGTPKAHGQRKRDEDANTRHTLIPALDHLAYANLCLERAAPKERETVRWATRSEPRDTYRSRLESNLVPSSSVPT